MRAGARIQAAIDLVAAVDTSTRGGGAAADDILRAYFRQRRYAGSKDRREVGTLLYAVLRRRGELAWRLGEAASPRLMVLLERCLSGAAPAALDAEFEGDTHAPEPLSESETLLIDKALSADAEAAPAWARHNFPAWMEASLRRRFGARMDEEMDGMTGRASVDLRVNTLRGKVADARAALPQAVPTPWISTGLRLEQDGDISSDPLYLGGYVEVQDEGSQIAAHLCGARRSMQVIDFCAGAGGKTLALAAAMGNTGQIYAHDSDARRLERLRPRAKRADARTIQYVDRADRLPAAADRVILDVPCSGTGTWRRNPEARWRLTPERLDEVTALQDSLLDAGAALVGKGGQLVYITCSLLPEEGEDRIAAFLARAPGFSALPYTVNWTDEGPVPYTLSHIPEYLVLSPASHQTDGFFVAVLERKE
ncbi:RsmB/NOP family class I SAM-dependent RNA methyltransferase [Iodidimonas sp. SYSU 1G8]|uniref:RsmB/NOP family class I SAM-dependent RNA methyltransferase n=1 Tax=Iodidimonas sp. SYSU 1G8 TaxID=3133967 RepID=UPI0031FF29B0